MPMAFLLGTLLVYDFKHAKALSRKDFLPFAA
jgi:hypothetical protein